MSKLLNLHTLCRMYTSVRDATIEARDAMYPEYTVVRLHNGNIAIVITNEDCPPDKLCLNHENSNNWFKPIDHVLEIVTDKKQWPKWVRDRVKAYRKSDCHYRHSLRVIKKECGTQCQS